MIISRHTCALSKCLRVVCSSVSLKPRSQNEQMDRSRYALFPCYSLLKISVEVRLQQRAATRFDTIRQRVQDWIHSFDRINLSTTIDGWEDVPELAAAVERIVVCECASTTPSLSIEEMALQIHVYQPTESDTFEEFSTNAEGDDDTMAASVCELPNRSWEGTPYIPRFNMACFIIYIFF